MSIYSEQFGKKLRQIMEEKNIRQADLVQRTGIHHGTITNYYKGLYMPRGEKLTKIANALNVSEAYLCGYSDEAALDNYLDNLSEGTAGILVSDPEETAVIQEYRKADEKTRKAVRVLLGLE